MSARKGRSGRVAGARAGAREAPSGARVASGGGRVASAGRGGGASGGRTARGGRGRVVVAVAAVAATVFVGAVVLRAVLAPEPEAPDGARPEAGDIIDLGGGTAGVASAAGLRLQLTDRADPSRLAMELAATRMDPVARDTYRVSDLRAWIYRSDGSRLWVRADAGTLILPDRSREPDSGSLTGGVVILRFKDPAPGAAIDPEADTPEITVRTDSLTFDQLGEVSTEDRVVVTTADGELAGSGLRILVNESRESLMLARLARGEYLRVRRERAGAEGPAPEEASSGAPAAPVVARSADAIGAMEEPEGASIGSDPAALAAAEPGGDGAPPAESAVTTAAAMETRYRATFESDVVLRDGPRTVAGDRLEVWARLFDNTLRPGAIGGTDGAVVERGSDAGGVAVEPAQQRAALDAGGPSASEPTTELAGGQSDGAGSDVAASDSASEYVELTWSGALEIRPLADTPVELDGNDVTARVTAERTGLVRLADESSGAAGSAGTVDYHATTRDLWLTAPGAEGVRLETADGGVARFGRLELNLGTGVGHVPGPGIVESAEAGRVEWREQADLLFRTEGGSLTAELAEAMCAGGARASQDAGSIESQFLRAVFQPGDGGRSELRRLVASDGVRLADGRGGEGRADHLDVRFTTDASGEPQPASFVARGGPEGGARFSDGPDFVEGGVVDATLMPDERGDITVRRMHAVDAVTLERRRDGVVVRGRDVVLDAERQTIDATGPDAVVQRLGARITGDVVRLDGIAGTASVAGRGTFQHRTLGEGGFVSSFDASWTRGMSFDDATGLLLCDGGVSASHRPDALTRDTVLADAVRAELTTPEAPIAAADGLALAPIEQRQERELRRFVAIAGDDGRLAVVEASRSVPDEHAGDGQRLARALRLKGLEIIADQEAGLIEVPSRGELLAADLREGAGGEGAGGEDDRGSALFTWAGSMRYSRASGRATLEGGATMAHRRLDGGATVIEAGTLAADIATDATTASADTAASASLRRVWAIGSVYARSGDREMVADEAMYDPIGGRAEAFASPGRRVTVLDTRTGSPLRAQRVFWDMRVDRVEIDSPARLDGLR